MGDSLRAKVITKWLFDDDNLPLKLKLPKEGREMLVNELDRLNGIIDDKMDVNHPCNLEFMNDAVEDWEKNENS